MASTPSSPPSSPSPAAAGGLSVAQAYLALLKERGIDKLYVGAGTDTAPVIEAYARAGAAGQSLPEPVLAVHENLAVGMAHGYYMVSGRPQAVMLHVSVGAANAVCGLLNAARARVPMLFTAGRTPLFEQGRLGSRTHEVHWAQEMFDQAGMVRELVKWDYELRDGLQLEQVVDRALNVAMAEPRGPVYLTLPREVLAQPHPADAAAGGVVRPSEAHPAPEAVARLAEALLAARHPAIVCAGSGADPATVPLLAELATRHAIGVVENRARLMCFPAGHPLHLGHEIAPVLAQADALCFLETDVPWIPSAAAPRDDAFVAHAGTDPLYVRYPMRSFRADLAIAASPAALLRALLAELDRQGGTPARADARESRRAHLEAFARERQAIVDERAARDEAEGGPITKRYFTRCLEAVRPSDAIVVNEYPVLREHTRFTEPGTFFQLPAAGGLGWGLPAALGAKQAQPGRTVICALGDGAYLFCNPAACHQAAAMHRLPVLTVIYNNDRWDGVQSAVTGMYPGDSHTARHIQAHEVAPLSSLSPLPAFERYAEASGGHGERVTERAQLLPALQRALDVVQNEGRQAVVNVIGV